jgi:hypothetical protein
LTLLHCRRADFTKKANFLQICIFLRFDGFYREAVNIKISVVNKHILFVKYFYQKGPWALA